MEGVVLEPEITGPLDWFHYNVILPSRSISPITLMIGFTLYGNIMLRRESSGKPYPNWILGWPVGMLVYAYPGSIWSELLFQSRPPRAIENNNILFWYSFWYLMIQFYEPAYKFFMRRHVFIWLTVWWMAEVTRVSLLTVERTVTHTPSFARGVWQCFFWVAVVPVVRCIELSGRGLPTPKLDTLVPNTLNLFKHPAISMFMLMISYLFYLTFLTDCNIFGSQPGPRLTATECGEKHQEVWAGFVYTAMLLHVGRAYYALVFENRVVFGDFCLACTPPRVTGVSNDDLEAPLLSKGKEV